jgi:hypothetical protein
VREPPHVWLVVQPPHTKFFTNGPNHVVEKKNTINIGIGGLDGKRSTTIVPNIIIGSFHPNECWVYLHAT